MSSFQSLLLLSWIFLIDIHAYGQILTLVGKPCEENQVTLSCTMDSFDLSVTWRRAGLISPVTCIDAGCDQNTATINGNSYSFNGNSSGSFVSFEVTANDFNVDWTCNYNATDVMHSLKKDCGHDEPDNTTHSNDAIIAGVTCGVVLACLVLIIFISLYWKHKGRQSQLLCKVEGQVSPVDGKRGETPATTEDITLLKYFALPKGYMIKKWITEEQPSIENSPRYLSLNRGSLVVKSATENDNGIFQGIFTYDGDNQRVNAVLHVTGNNSVNLVVRALLWRQVKNKNLKNVNDLKDIRHKISNNDIANIPKKKEKEGESKVRIKKVMWTHDGQLEQNSCDFKQENSDVSPLTVTLKKKPIEDYHCTVEFTNKRSHEYIFIVKFTGVPSNRNNDDVIGVPTIFSTKREERNVTLAPLRETKPTTEQFENSVRQATARSDHSTGTEDNPKI